jgi:hypothetical protein
MTDAHKHMIAGRTPTKKLPRNIIVGLLPRLDRFEVVRAINPSGPNTEDVEDNLTVVRKVAFDFESCYPKCGCIVEGSGDGSITCNDTIAGLQLASRTRGDSRSQRRRHRSRHRRAEEEQNGVHVSLGITIIDHPSLASASPLHYHRHQP